MGQSRKLRDNSSNGAGLFGKYGALYEVTSDWKLLSKVTSVINGFEANGGDEQIFQMGYSWVGTEIIIGPSENTRKGGNYPSSQMKYVIKYGLQ